MPHYEYTRWDGSQQFQPQSADKVFDQLTEYLLPYGEQVLRDLDRLDDDESPEILELIQKEGLIEKDDEGKWQVSPKGLRRIQESALGEPLPDLQQGCDRPARHAAERGGDRPARGLEAVRLRRLAGEPEPPRDAQERLHPPGGRPADPPPCRRLRRLRDRISDPLRHRGADRHERLDGALRQVRHDQEGGAGAAGDGPRAVRAGQPAG